MATKVKKYHKHDTYVSHPINQRHGFHASRIGMIPWNKGKYYDEKNYKYIYNIWILMRARCYKKYADSYKNYHNRGILVCNRWKIFDRFYEDMASTYQRGLYLDRINNDLGYSPENCRWATPLVSANNTSRNRYIKYHGIIKTLSEWGRIFNVHSSLLKQRFYVYKWDIDKCLNYRRSVI